MAVPVVLFVVAGLVALAGIRPGLRTLVAAGVLIAAAAGVFLAVIEDEALTGADLPVLAYLVEHRTPGATTAAEALSLAGGTVPTAGLALVAAVALAWRGRWRSAVVWVVGVVVGALAIRLLKVTVERPRPPLPTRLAVETSASLPSGHSLMAVLGLGLAAAAVVRLVRSTSIRTVCLAVAAVLAFAIGASRAYLGVHWTTDVLAGWLLGAGLAVVCVTVAGQLEERAGDGPSDGSARSSPTGGSRHGPVRRGSSDVQQDL